MVRSYSPLCLWLSVALLLPSSVLPSPIDPSDPQSDPHRGDTSDEHGGVVMGIPSDFCDNGKDYVSLDWDPDSKDEYTCDETLRQQTEFSKGGNGVFENCTIHYEKPVHKCYPTKLSYKDPLPTSGWHRPLWPKYGEYKYCPPHRWLHSLEHGAIVFLYNPCVDQSQINVLKSVAKGCLFRHIISPYKLIPDGYNFALLAWKCKLLLEDADKEKMINFVKDHALKGPEAVWFDGQYELGLLHGSDVVSDMKDSKICPHPI